MFNEIYKKINKKSYLSEKQLDTICKNMLNVKFQN